MIASLASVYFAIEQGDTIMGLGGRQVVRRILGGQFFLEFHLGRYI